jgi:hypothetical protein
VVERCEVGINLTQLREVRYNYPEGEGRCWDGLKTVAQPIWPLTWPSLGEPNPNPTGNALGQRAHGVGQGRGMERYAGGEEIQCHMRHI